MRNINDEGVHDFVLPSDVDAILLDEGQWDDFARRPERLAQIAQNKISYAWDELIETFIKHALAGTHYFSTHSDIKDSERIYRFLAREPRLKRRFLARSLIELIERTPPKLRAARLILPCREGDPYYVFVLLPHLKGIPYDEYRDVRVKLLESYCRVTRLTYREALDIIGIATESGNYPRRSEDVIYFDGRVWTEDDRVDAKSLKDDLGLLKELKMFAGREKEYPDVDHLKAETSTRPMFKLPPNPRNKPCPCGSGIKYKRCHGRD